MKNNSSLFALTLSGVLSLTGATLSPAQGTYHFIKEIPVGGEGGWDYLSVDENAHRLYVSHGSKVVVIDLEKDGVVGEVPDTPGVHGVAVAADLGKGFSSSLIALFRIGITEYPCFL